MSARLPLVMCAAIILSLVVSRDASAHRLDEYLQATRVEIEVGRIGLEIDLTPGANIANDVLGWIDRDGDHALSTSERDAYVREVLREITLRVDDATTSLTIVSSEFPSWDAVGIGTGSIRVRAVATTSSGAGRHRLALVNAHRPQQSAYLANVLVSHDVRVRVGQQRRDPLQRELDVDYDVTSSGSRLVWLLGALAMLGCVVAARRGTGARRA